MDNTVETVTQALEEIIGCDREEANSIANDLCERFDVISKGKHSVLLECERLLRRECKDTGSQGMVDIYATLTKLEEIRKGN